MPAEGVSGEATEQCNMHDAPLWLEKYCTGTVVYQRAISALLLPSRILYPVCSCAVTLLYERGPPMRRGPTPD